IIGTNSVETTSAKVLAFAIVLSWSSIVDNKLSILQNPVTVATNDMSAFPDVSVSGIDKKRDPNGNAYQAGDKDGFILFQHDIIADNAQTGLVSYITVQYTKGTYAVDATGRVTQVTTGYE
ncbi:unnamed protein product, partial [marine sediment metagenome]